MRQKRKLSPYGLKIKHKLLELEITQKEFCQEHNIAESRLSEVIRGKKGLKLYKEKISRALGIPLEEMDESC